MPSRGGGVNSSLSPAVCSLHHSALRTDPGASTLSLITARAPPLLVGTPAALLVMDPRTYELLQVIPFGGGGGPDGGGGGASMFDDLDGAAACFAFGVSPSRSLRCTVSGAFGSNALVLDVEPVELSAAQAAAETAATAAANAAAKAGRGGGERGGGRGKGNGPGGLDGVAVTLAVALASAEARAAVVDRSPPGSPDTSFERGNDAEEVISIFPTAPLPDGSGLLADPVRPHPSSPHV